MATKSNPNPGDVTALLEGVTALAVVGVAKNCGKTTTLTRLIEWSIGAGETVGIVSVGIDGEARDELLGHDKPRVYLPAGHLVATVRHGVEASSARIEYVQPLGFSTPMGEAVIGRVLEPGSVVLAGMRHRKDVVAARRVMESRGTTRILIDGAFDRLVAASPSVSDGVIVSTGAILAPTPDGIVRKTSPFVEKLRLPDITLDWHRRLVERAITENRCVVGGPDANPVLSSEGSALLAIDELRESWGGTMDVVAVPGLVSNRVAEGLLDLREEGATLLISDPTVLQMDPDIWRCLSEGWQVRARRVSPLVAVSLNPTGVQGRRVDPQRLYGACRRRWPSIRFFDPMMTGVFDG